MTVTNSLDIRCELAADPNTPVHVLEVLAYDSDVEVRFYVAKNPNTPVHVLEVLAKDSCWGVCCEVAENLNIPVRALEILAYNPDKDVRLVRNLNRGDYLVWWNDEDSESILLNFIYDLDTRARIVGSSIGKLYLVPVNEKNTNRLKQLSSSITELYFPFIPPSYPELTND